MRHPCNSQSAAMTKGCIRFPDIDALLRVASGDLRIAQPALANSGRGYDCISVDRLVGLLWPPVSVLILTVLDASRFSLRSAFIMRTYFSALQLSRRRSPRYGAAF